MVKTKYPALYERVKQAVAKGQWVPEGGMWVEADTNISGGEALVRQFLYGKRFFQEEFGADCELLWPVSYTHLDVYKRQTYYFRFYLYR